MGSTAPRALARIEHSEALLVAIRRRLDELQLTHETVDQLAGFSSGYAGKLLSDPPTKRMGHFSLFLILQTLGLDMVLVENPDALETLMKPALKRRQRWIHKAPRIVVLTPDMLRANGIKGGHARAKKLSPKQLSKIGRKAVMARWAKYRRKVQALAAAASPPAPASP
jgi:hypothetical protein